MWQHFVGQLDKLTPILQMQYLQNRILDYLLCILLFGVLVLITTLFEKSVLRRIKIWAAGKNISLGNLFITICEKDIIPLCYFGAFYVSVHHLKMHPALTKGIHVLGILLVTFVTLRALSKILQYVLHLGENTQSSRQLVSQGIFTLVKIVLWGFAIVFLLDNFGFKISTVIAGLGIGGIAIALAAQTILGDLFHYFVILLDQPFAVGDFIVVGDYMGTVEYLGIKTTRIRSLSGEQLVFSNTDLTNSRIRNYKRMARRRIPFALQVSYQTSLAQLKEIPQILTDIVKKIPEAELERAHFVSYGNYSLNFEIVYHVLSGDYAKYMDIQQQINLAIKEEFEKRHIEFAYPTQLLYVK